MISSFRNKKGILVQKLLNLSHYPNLCSKYILLCYATVQKSVSFWKTLRVIMCAYLNVKREIISPTEIIFFN